MEKSKFTITGQTGVKDVKFEAAGYVIYDTAVMFEKTLSDAIGEEPESITIDMEKVVVFTSIGIRVILKAYKLTNKKGIIFKIENPSDIVRNVLKLSKLDTMLLEAKGEGQK